MGTIINLCVVKFPIIITFICFYNVKWLTKRTKKSKNLVLFLKAIHFLCCFNCSVCMLNLCVTATFGLKAIKKNALVDV